MKKTLLLCITCMVLSSSAFSQNRSWQGGLQLNCELTLWDGGVPGAGFQLIYRGNKNAGFETGLVWQLRSYRYVIVDYALNEPDYNMYVNNQRLQIPLLYRNHGKFLNFSAGAVIDFYIGPDIENYKAITSDYNDRLKTGIQALIATSHTFQLKNGWIMEPALSVNYKYHKNLDDDGGLGIHVSFRKKIF